MPQFYSSLLLRVGDHVVVNCKHSSYYGAVGVVSNINEEKKRIRVELSSKEAIEMDRDNFSLVLTAEAAKEAERSNRSESIVESFLKWNSPGVYPYDGCNPYRSKGVNWGIQKNRQEYAYQPSCYIVLPEILLSSIVPETNSATIVLASGREVRMPDPGPGWELVETQTDLNYLKVHASLIKDAPAGQGSGSLHLGEGVGKRLLVMHEPGLCWLGDMCNIINKIEKKGPFETKFSYVTELRKFVIKKKHDEVPHTLSVLW